MLTYDDEPADIILEIQQSPPVYRHMEPEFSLIPDLTDKVIQAVAFVPASHNAIHFLFTDGSKFSYETMWKTLENDQLHYDLPDFSVVRWWNTGYTKGTPEVF
jgi:hypothetical protein